MGINVKTYKVIASFFKTQSKVIWFLNFYFYSAQPSLLNEFCFGLVLKREGEHLTCSSFIPGPLAGIPQRPGWSTE